MARIKNCAQCGYENDSERLRFCARCNYPVGVPLVEIPEIARRANRTNRIGCWAAIIALIGCVGFLISQCSSWSTSSTVANEHSNAPATSDETLEIISFGVATKAKILELLKDPDSASFRNVAAYRQPAGNGYVFCGEVNAKNGFGGYSGYQRFVGSPIAAALESMDADEFSKGWIRLCDPSQKVELASWF